MKTRDYNDKNRENCPLIKTEDSLYIDTSNISEKMVLDIAIKELSRFLDIDLIHEIIRMTQITKNLRLVIKVVITY